MSLKKQSLILFIVVALFGLGQVAIKHLSQQSSPEKLALFFVENHLLKDEIKKYVTSEDQKILELNADYLKLTKLSKTKYSKLSLAADVALTDRAHKVDVNTDQGLVSVSIVKENNEWVVFLNLKESYEIDQLLSQITDAELREDEFEMLSLYKKINLLLPSDFYQEKITRLEKYIAKNKKQSEYVKNIYIDNLKLTGRILTAAVKNQGDEKVKTVKGKLQIINPKDGAIEKEFDIVIYEVIPGSFVFGEPILPNYMKKIGLNLQSLPEITDVKSLYLSVSSVEFMEE